MKNFYMIGGTMGIGKTSTCKFLKNKLPNSVFLDGDWCWDMNPFQINNETKSMVMENICYMLNNFLKCSCYDNIIFCWVMHKQEIINSILETLDLSEVKLHLISLVCERQTLYDRLMSDVAAGIRNTDVIFRSIEYLPLFYKLNTDLLDVTDVSPEQAANLIRNNY